VLRLISPEASEADLRARADQIVAASTVQTGSASFWSARLRTPILLAFLIAFFNQLSGVNAILYFAKRILEETGLTEKEALLHAVSIGATNLVFTFVGLWLIDRLGRKTLLTVGSFGYIASLGLCAWAFFAGQTKIVPACLFVFIAAHAVGQGAVIWVYISEIFPTRYRAAGQSLGSATHWVFAALIATVFPKVIATFDAGWVFAFFCAMMVLQLVWVRTSVIETKGVPLEEVQKKLGVV
jgi:MFS family permease